MTILSKRFVSVGIKKMSETSKPLVNIDIDDIYLHSKQIGNPVTKKEAVEIWESIDSSQWDCENSTFWGFIEQKIRSFKSD